MSDFLDFLKKNYIFFDENNCLEITAKIHSVKCPCSRDKNNKLIWTEFNLEPYYDTNKKVLGYVGQCPVCRKTYFRKEE